MRARSFLTLLAAACAIAVSPAAATAADTVQINAAPVKASANSLAVKKVVFSSTNRAAVLLGGSVTFKSGRRKLRATVIEVTITSAWSQFSAKLGKARYTLFTTRGPIVLNQANGDITSGNLALTISGAARRALNKALGLKGAKRLRSSRAGTAKFDIGAPPAAPQPPLPDPPAPPQPPVADIVTGPEGLTANNSPSFTFVADQTATFMCAIDDAAPAACTSPQSYSDLADGEHSFSVYAANSNGNGATASRTFTVDTTAPTISVDLGSDTIRSSSHQVGIAANEAATFKCSLHEAAPTACGANYNLQGLVNGANDFNVSATDAAGNVATHWLEIHVYLNVTLCGTLNEDRTLDPADASVYMVTCDLTVAEGAGLTIEPNTVLKFAANKKLVVDGSLDVNGALFEEAVFTSAADDQIGGDSNGDSSSTDAAAGDWGGIVLRPGSDSSVDIFRARIRYATDGVKSQKGAADTIDFNVQQNWFQDLSGDAVNFAAAGSPAPPTITGNEIDDSIGGLPLVIDSPAIDQTAIGHNQSPLDKPWVISGTLVGDGDIPSTYNTIATKGITIAADAELELSGEIWKFAPGAGLRVRGNLRTTDGGQWTTFTSAGDDDGASSPWQVPAAAAGDWRGIYTTPGDDATIDLTGARIFYAEKGISSVKHAADYSTFKLGNADVRWASEAGVEYSMGEGAVASPVPSIKGVYVHDVDGPGFTINSPKIDQTKLENIMAQDVRGQLLLAGKLVGDGPLGTDALVPLADGLEIASGATLAVGPGDVWKFAVNTALTVNGSLEVSGEPNDPLFTSERDDAYGDSNGDAGATTPATGDWRGIKAGTSPGAEIDIDHVRVDYAQIGVDRPSNSNAASFSVANSLIRNATTAIRFEANSPGVAAPTIEYNYVEDIDGDGIAIDSPNIDQQSLYFNQGTDLSTPLRLSGTLTGNGELRSYLTNVIDGLTVAGGSTFVISQPDTWIGASNKSLVVKGTMVVSPDFGQEIQIAAPVGPYWNGIVVDGGVLSATRLHISRARTGVSLYNGAAYLQDSTIAQSDVGIDAYNNSFAEYTGSIAGLSIGARTDGSSTIQAANTWWGAANGPQPSGSGSQVLGDVTFMPYLSSAP